jgi:acetyl esterase/lipase
MASFCRTLTASSCAFTLLAGCGADMRGSASVAVPENQGEPGAATMPPESAKPHNGPKLALAPVLRDQAYGTSPRQVLDLYLPNSPNPAPLVIFIHGGRWFRGGKEQAEEYGRINALIAAGFAVATINYRYSTMAIWPAQQDDVLAAIGWLRSRHQAFRIDPERLALWGQSSGAHMALMTAAYLASRDDRSLSAVVAWFPPSDLAGLRQDRIDDTVPGANEAEQEPTPESLLIGAPVTSAPDLANAASPAHVLAALPARVRLPAILLVHGTADPAVSPLQSQRLYQTLKARPGTVAQLREVSKGQHGGAGFEAETAPSVDFILAGLPK